MKTCVIFILVYRTSFEDIQIAMKVRFLPFVKTWILLMSQKQRFSLLSLFPFPFSLFPFCLIFVYQKASMIWIIGEYADRIGNSDELLETFLDTFHDESTQVNNFVIFFFFICSFVHFFISSFVFIIFSKIFISGTTSTPYCNSQVIFEASRRWTRFGYSKK